MKRMKMITDGNGIRSMIAVSYTVGQVKSSVEVMKSYSKGSSSNIS